jgi:SAM-dependent methyltransferase
MKYYDQVRNRLVFIQRQATPEFWDELWEKEYFRELIVAGKNDRFILNTTKRYLQAGKILEGGCGRGAKVYALHHHGYDAYGVDFATATIKKINSSIPDLKVFPANVMHLPFRSTCFDGYWSLGVIEHFYGGYGTIADEMKRVLKPGGILFLTFPYMSPLRRLKSKAGYYPLWNSSIGAESFYQFALDKDKVIKEFEMRGFHLLESIPYDGIKGFKDEVQIVSTPFQCLYDYSGKNAIIRIIRYALDSILRLFAGHIILLVLKKNTDL